MARKITAALLRRRDACSDSIALFNKLFPNGVVPTRELAKIHASQFDFDWAAKTLLCASALAEYERVCAPAWAEYNRVRMPAWAEYERIRAPAWTEYERIRAPALAEYERVCALAFVDAWLSTRG